MTERIVNYKTLDYIIDATSLTIKKSDGTSINLRPKTCQFLLILLEQAGSVVSKQQLLEMVWPNTVVEEQIVFQSVNELRQAFNDKSLIKTIPKQGYIWVAEVETIESNLNQPILNIPILKKTGIHHQRIKKTLIISLCLALISLFIYLLTHTNNLTSVKETSIKSVDDPTEGVYGSVVVLPTLNQIPGNDHSWVRLGLMDQIIHQLPSDEQHGILHTDYVLEVLERASAPNNDVQPKHIKDIFKVSGANLIVATKLSGEPHNYQLSYNLYRPQFKQQGVLFATTTQSLVDQLSALLTTLLGQASPKTQDQYHTDFDNQMLGVAIDLQLEGKDKSAIPLLQSIIETTPHNFTAQRLLIQSWLALNNLDQAIEQLDQILPIAEQQASPYEYIRLLYFQAISLAQSNKFEHANAVIDSAIVITKEHYDWLYQAYFTRLKAQIAIENQDFAAAESLFYQAMTYHQILKCPVGETITWIDLALLAKTQSEFEKQTEALNKAREIAVKRELTHHLIYIDELRKE